MKKIKKSEISLAKKHRFPNRKKLVNREIKTVVLMYINPINSKKYVTSFSWIFHFWLIDFSNKIFEFFLPLLNALGYVDLCKMLEVKKIIFEGHIFKARGFIFPPKTCNSKTLGEKGLISN